MDISEKTEKSYLYRIYGSEKEIFILEDKTVKDRNKVKNLLTRYIFSNNAPLRKNFNASIKKQKKLKNQTKKNCYLMNKVHDTVEPNGMKCFLNLQRFRDDLTFVKRDDVVISIGFDGSH